jgi:hypothetical protein
MDDFNMTLQLLTKGYTNVISLVYRASPAPSNARGGASTWRTLETQNASAHKMKELFPDFVTVREKDTWQGMAGQMFDITAKWKKALEYGKLMRTADGNPYASIDPDFSRMAAGEYVIDHDGGDE